MRYDALNELGPAQSFVTDVVVAKWGCDVTVTCLYDPDGTRQPYQLSFKDCDEVAWQILRPEEAEETGAALIDFAIGRKDDRKVAMVVTDIFELLVYYGEFTIDRSW